MMRLGGIGCMLSVVMGLGSWSAQAAPILRVSTQVLSSASTIAVGETVRVGVTAVVEDPAGANDGIFTYSLDLVLAEAVLGAGVPLEVVGVNRPGVAPVLPGGDGTVVANGLDQVHGGFLEMNRGVGTAVTLFTVDLRGTAEGSATVTPSPEPAPFLTDFFLYTSEDDFEAVYPAPLTITVVPEPVWLGGTVGLWMMLGRRRGRVFASQ